ncbi:PAS domain S-box protein [Lutibacter sp.]|uniref:PAS domain S-box protein n=1 Tax=Lutibacter sp. TaxID=1925666 RepID=UPI00356388EC
MEERIVKNGSNEDIKNTTYFSFFEYAPIALFIEDFSQAKLLIEKKLKEYNTDLSTLLTKHPSIVEELASLVQIKDVNSAAVSLYKANSKKDLFENLNKVFTEKSNAGFTRLIKDILLGKTEVELESVNKTLEGKEFDILIKYKVAEESLTSLENIIISVEDITEKVKIRNKLAESEHRYKESQAIAKLGSWHYDFLSKEIYWTDETYNMLGLIPQSVTPTLEFYLSFVFDDDKNIVNNFSITNLLKNQNQVLSYRVKTAKNEIKFISEHRSVLVKKNRIVKIIGTAQDVTERVLAEQEINTTKNLLSDTFSGIKEGFALLDTQLNYVYLNDKAANILGKRPKDILGKNILKEFPVEEGDLFFANLKVAIETNKPINFENYFKPWDRWFENRIIPSSKGIMLFFHEITEKKERENRIKEAYNIINKSSSIAILCENKRDFPVIFASENIVNLFGYDYKEFLNGDIKIYQLVFPEDLNFIRNEVFSLVKSNLSTLKPKPFRIYTKNKKIKWVKANIDVIRDFNNEISHIQGIIEDYTEQKNIEDLLFKSNQQLKHQFNNTPLASIIWDTDYKILEWNKAAEHIFGYTAQEVLGKSSPDLLTPPHLLGKMKTLRETSFVQNKSFRQTNENITKSGKIIICDWYSVTLKESDGTIVGAACLVDDITDRIKAKILLEKSERKYKDIFEKSIDSVLIIKNGLFSDCNKASLKMFGFKTKEELVKLHPSQLSPEFQSDGENSFDKAEKVMKIAIDNGFNRFRWHHKRANGVVFPVQVTLTKIEDIDNKTTIHAVLVDITERVKIEQIENVLYNISKGVSVIEDFNEFSLYIKEELHKIIDTSNFYIGMYDESTDMIKMPILVDEKEHLEEFPAKKSLTGYVIKSGKSLMLTDKEHQQLIKQGIVDLVGFKSEIWVGVPLKIQNKTIGAIVVQSYTNENAYKQSDLQLLEFVADQISSAIQRKNSDDELKKALAKAQESDKLKSAFLANMSHEIRTPMNGIIGFSELFLKADLSYADRKRYANIVVTSSKQLLNIVNDILDISKIEAGVVKLNYEATNMNHLIDDLYVFYKQIASDHKLELVVKKGLDSAKSFIEIDGPKLNQVLTNLLSNSFKFTEQGGIEFGYELKDDETLLFFVKDTGVGIDKELHAVIFDRFTQANLNLSKQSKGTGLGLAISKKFVELFNGEIWIDSNNKGTSVYFTIPYLKSKQKPITTVLEQKIAQIPMENIELTILIAEDEEYNMLYINELFSNTKIKVIEAFNGLEAVNLAKANPNIDLILMDIKMPILNGFEAMNEIKKFNPKVPIIALSAFAMESDKETALEKGFTEYLSKPIDRKKLFAILGSFANNSKSNI